MQTKGATKAIQATQIYKLQVQTDVRINSGNANNSNKNTLHFFITDVSLAYNTNLTQLQMIFTAVPHKI